MLLLNNREYQQFETAYQNLRTHPEWKMENIFFESSAEHEAFKRCSRLFYTRSSKPNRLNLAAHEAGHAVVMAAVHARVAEAKIDIENHPEGWANSLSLATTYEITFVFSSYGYLDVSVPRVRYLSICISSIYKVSLFGHPWINGRLHLPTAFRSLPRPSSPLRA